MYLQATTMNVWSACGQTPIVRVDPGRSKAGFYGTLDLKTGHEIVTRSLVFNADQSLGGGLVLAIVAALLQAQGWPPLVGVAVVYALGQVVESFLLTPYLVGERIGLHPLAVIFVLMAFGQLFGFVGVLVALPVSALLVVAVRRLRVLYLDSPLYRG